MTKICFLADADSIHTKKWVDYFSRYNYEIHLISMRNTSYEYKENVKLYILKPKTKNKISYLLLIPQIKKLVKNINPDILHSHYATSYGLFGRLCFFHPFIISIWGSDLYEFPGLGYIHEKIFKFILKGGNIVCTTSHAMALRTKEYCNNRIDVTHFGVDTELFSNISPILSNKHITIGTVRNLEQIYGINILISAFAELSKELNDLDLKLLILGDGSQKHKLMKLCESLNISSHVTFTGFIDNNLVSTYINKMDIVCMPSLSEGFGVSAVEACACGRPIVASNVGGLTEIVNDNYNGYLIEPGDINALKNTLKKLITDKKRLLEFSKNARKIAVENYNWDKNASEMRSIYNNYVNPKFQV
ncbi:MAG: glycosyltransferase [Clostridiaceae bacterium]|nr:glycosyltransferase [Clostridiaceae bacterium]